MTLRRLSSAKRFMRSCPSPAGVIARRILAASIRPTVFAPQRREAEPAREIGEFRQLAYSAVLRNTEVDEDACIVAGRPLLDRTQRALRLFEFQQTENRP